LERLPGGRPSLLTGFGGSLGAWWLESSNEKSDKETEKKEPKVTSLPERRKADIQDDNSYLLRICTLGTTAGLWHNNCCCYCPLVEVECPNQEK